MTEEQDYREQQFWQAVDKEFPFRIAAPANYLKMIQEHFGEHACELVMMDEWHRYAWFASFDSSVSMRNEEDALWLKMIIS